MDKFWGWMLMNSFAVIYNNDGDSFYSKFSLCDSMGNFNAPEKRMLIGYMQEYLYENERRLCIYSGTIDSFFNELVKQIEGV